MLTSKVKIIIIPGIFKRESFLDKFNDYCLKNNLDAEIFRIEWLEKDMYKLNEEKLIKKIKGYSKKYDKIYLIGTSAGGSVAVNTYSKLNGLVNKVICICAPLKEEGLTLALGEMISDKFKDSLSSAVRSLESLDKKLRNNILSFIPLYDELVPLRAMRFGGIKSKKIDSREHLLSISKVINDEIPSIAAFFDLN